MAGQEITPLYTELNRVQRDLVAQNPPPYQNMLQQDPSMMPSGSIAMNLAPDPFSGIDRAYMNSFAAERFMSNTQMSRAMMQAAAQSEDQRLLVRGVGAAVGGIAGSLFGGFIGGTVGFMAGAEGIPWAAEQLGLLDQPPVADIQEQTRAAIAATMHRTAWNIMPPYLTGGARGMSPNEAQDMSSELLSSMQGMGYQGLEATRLMPMLEQAGLLENINSSEEYMSRLESHFQRIAEFVRTLNMSFGDAVQLLQMSNLAGGGGDNALAFGGALAVGQAWTGISGADMATGISGALSPLSATNMDYGSMLTSGVNNYLGAAAASQLTSSPESWARTGGIAGAGALYTSIGANYLTQMGLGAGALVGPQGFNEDAWSTLLAGNKLPSSLTDAFSGSTLNERYARQAYAQREMATRGDDLGNIAVAQMLGSLERKGITDFDAQIMAMQDIYGIPSAQGQVLLDTYNVQSNPVNRMINNMSSQIAQDQATALSYENTAAASFAIGMLTSQPGMYENNWSWLEGNGAASWMSGMGNLSGLSPALLEGASGAEALAQILSGDPTSQLTDFFSDKLDPTMGWWQAIQAGLARGYNASWYAPIFGSIEATGRYRLYPENAIVAQNELTAGMPESVRRTYASAYASALTGLVDDAQIGPRSNIRGADPNVSNWNVWVGSDGTLYSGGSIMAEGGFVDDVFDRNGALWFGGGREADPRSVYIEIGRPEAENFALQIMQEMKAVSPSTVDPSAGMIDATDSLLLDLARDRGIFSDGLLGPSLGPTRQNIAIEALNTASDNYNTALEEWAAVVALPTPGDLAELDSSLNPRSGTDPGFVSFRNKWMETDMTEFYEFIRTHDPEGNRDQALEIASRLMFDGATEPRTPQERDYFNRQLAFSAPEWGVQEKGEAKTAWSNLQDATSTYTSAASDVLNLSIPDREARINQMMEATGWSKDAIRDVAAYGIYVGEANMLQAALRPGGTLPEGKTREEAMARLSTVQGQIEALRSNEDYARYGGIAQMYQTGGDEIGSLAAGGGNVSAATTMAVLYGEDLLASEARTNSLMRSSIEGMLPGATTARIDELVAMAERGESIVDQLPAGALNATTRAFWSDPRGYSSSAGYTDVERVLGPSAKGAAPWNKGDSQPQLNIRSEGQATGSYGDPLYVIPIVNASGAFWVPQPDGSMKYIEGEAGQQAYADQAAQASTPTGGR